MVDHDVLHRRWLGALVGARGGAADPDPAPYGENLLAAGRAAAALPHARPPHRGPRPHRRAGGARATTRTWCGWPPGSTTRSTSPTARENEERSARLAERALPEAGVSGAGPPRSPASSGSPSPTTRPTTTATARSCATPTWRSWRRPPTAYAAYTAAVREEYALRAGRRLPGGPRGGPAPTPGPAQAVQDAVRGAGVGGAGPGEPAGELARLDDRGTSGAAQ